MGRVTTMGGMFQLATSFDQMLPAWDTARVTDMVYMFCQASSFNQAFPAWDTVHVTDMSYMFANATSFNRVLPMWDTANVSFLMPSGFTNLYVCGIQGVTNMIYVFAYAYA
jgi:hypothetical protein